MLLENSCICQCKDTNFKANHNLISSFLLICLVVFANAKILILKLITTAKQVLSNYESCICQCKDTNFKANHNKSFGCLFAWWVVFANAKILILKLITTATPEREREFLLYLPMQRY